MTSINNKVESIHRETGQNTKSLNDLLARNDTSQELTDLERRHSARFTDLEKEIERLGAARDQVQEEIERLHVVNTNNQRGKDEEQRRLRDDFESLKNSMIPHDHTKDRLRDNENDLSNLRYELETFKQDMLSRPTIDYADAGTIPHHFASIPDSAPRVTSQSLQRAGMGLGYNEHRSSAGQLPPSSIGSARSQESTSLQPPISVYRWKVRCGRDVEETPDLVDELAPMADPVYANEVSQQPQNVVFENEGSTTEDDLLEQPSPRHLGTHECARDEPSMLDILPTVTNTNTARGTNASPREVLEDRHGPRKHHEGGRSDARSHHAPATPHKLQQSQRGLQLSPRKTRSSRRKEGESLRKLLSPLQQLDKDLRPEPQSKRAPPGPPFDTAVVAESQDEHTLHQNAARFESQRHRKDASSNGNSLSSHRPRPTANDTRKNPNRAAKILQTIENPEDYVPAKARNTTKTAGPESSDAYGPDRQGGNLNAIAAPSLIVKLAVPRLGMSGIQGRVPILERCVNILQSYSAR